MITGQFALILRGVFLIVFILFLIWYIIDNFFPRNPISKLPKRFGEWMVKKLRL
jgi:uncharacterized membrane protein